MDHICRCSHCGGRFKVDVKHVGRRVKCPKCGEVTVVPTESFVAEPRTLPSEPSAAPSTPVAESPVSTRFQNPPDPKMDDAATAADWSMEASQFATPESPGRTPPPAKPSPLAAAKPPAPRAAAPASPPRPKGPPATSFSPAPTTPAPEPVKSVEETFKIVVDDGGKSQAGSSPVRPLVTKKKPANPLAKVIVAGSIGLALAVAGIAYFAWEFSQKSGPTDAGRTRLVLDWPESERQNAAVTIDGKRRQLPSSGPLDIEVSPGQHKLIVQRRGFEMIEFGFSLKAGESYSYRPEWKELGLAAVPGVTTPRVPPGRNGEPNPSIDVAPAGGPVGFSGWLQNLESAERIAKQQRKDILVVFAGSDWSQSTMDMAQNLFSNPEFRRFTDSRFVLVVIDTPRTEAGFNQIENTAQNQELVERYLIAQFPTVVLMDASARPFAIDGAFDESIEKYVQHLNRLAAQHGMRNDLLQQAASQKLTDDQRLEKARDAVTWLRENRLLRHYLAEVNAWHRLASSLDANNEQGRLEVFFEADWLVRLAASVIERKAAPVRQQLGELLTWSRSHKFVDPDRGVRLHLAAFQLAASLRDEEGAAKQIELAAAYVPKDAKLLKELNDARKAVASINQLSSGTAFVVDASGYLLTNDHVIDGPGKNVVRLPGQQLTVPAEVVQRDQARDMALLKIDPAPFGQLKPLELSAAVVKRAASVAVFGFPLGDDIAREIRITTGVVSALPDQSDERMLLLDCRVNPGNSGGPVLQRDGRVIGMITAKTTAGAGVDSYGMALPTKDLTDFLARRIPGYLPIDEPVGPAIDWETIDEKVTAGNSVLMVLKLRN